MDEAQSAAGQGKYVIFSLLSYTIGRGSYYVIIRGNIIFVRFDVYRLLLDVDE